MSGYDVRLSYFGPRPIEEVIDLIDSAICVGPPDNCHCQFVLSYKPINDEELNDDEHPSDNGPQLGNREGDLSAGHTSRRHQTPLVGW